MEKCKFQDRWLQREDDDKRLVAEWAQKLSDHEVFCRVCSKPVNIEKGFEALKRHSEGSKHKENAKLKLQPSQIRLCIERPSSSNASSMDNSATQVSESSKPGTIKLFSVRDKATTAEILWVLKCIVSDFPAASCHGIGDIFQAMFPAAVPSDFSLSRTKVRYLVTDALGPYFKDQLLKDIGHGSCFSLCYDETTNSAGKKELQIRIRYWSESQEKIVSHHLQTFFLGSATSNDIFGKLIDIIDTASLQVGNLVMLGSDGPNVNQKVSRLMNEYLQAQKLKPLLDIGTCNIHVLHNAFLKGLKELGQNASDLIIAVYHFFKAWPSRWSDFNGVQAECKLPHHHFIKHCTTRWLTIEGAAERLLQQWSAVTYYFLKHIPKYRKHLLSTVSYNKIVRLLKQSTIQAELMFVCSSAHIFTQFSELFQRQRPLIHLLYEQMHNLLKTIMGRVCKDSTLTSSEDDITAFVFKSENLKPLWEMVCGGDNLITVLSKVSEKDRLLFHKAARNHYVAAGKHLIAKSSLFTKSTLLKSFKCLQPQNKNCNTDAEVLNLARAMPFQIKIDELLDEWKLLQFESMECDTSNANDMNIEHYWADIFKKVTCTGNIKYPLVSRLMKAALSVSHGNADVERGFSQSCRVLTDDRASMSERTLNSVLTIKSAMQNYENRPQLLTITKELLTLARTAHQSYCNYLNEEKKKKEKELLKQQEEENRKAAEKEAQEQMKRKRKALEEEWKQLKCMRKEESEKRSTAASLFNEAHKRLRGALAAKNFQEASKAQAMLEVAENLQKEELNQKHQADQLQKSISQKQHSIINHFFSKAKSIQ